MCICLVTIIPHDDDFINILNDVSLLFYRYNPSHVVFGGDMNVDLSRMSPNSRILTDFITEFNLLPCIDLSQSNVPYKFIVRSNITSRLITYSFLPYYKKT